MAITIQIPYMSEDTFLPTMLHSFSYSRYRGLHWRTFPPFSRLLASLCSTMCMLMITERRLERQQYEP